MPAAEDDVFFADGGDAFIGESTTVKTLQVTNTATSVTVTIGDGQTLSILNTGAVGINAASADLTIDGGTLVFSTAGSGNELDNGVNAGHVLTLNAFISGTFGFEAWRGSTDVPGGTIIMGNETNDFTGVYRANAGHTVVVTKLADINSPSCIGAGDILRFANMATLRYEGAGDGMNRAVQLDGEGGRIEHNGQGELIPATARAVRRGWN